MRGLLIKDFGLLKGQARFFLVVVVVPMCMAYFMEDVSLILGYVPLIFPMFALSTISYDEYDNGNAFLFTLPITRRLYAGEKYVFALLLGGISLLVSLALAAAVAALSGLPFPPDALLVAAGVLAGILLVESVMIPLQLRFGAEKGRIAMFVVGGGIAALGMGAGKLLSRVGMDPSALSAALNALPALAVAAAMLGILTLVLTLSWQISTSILKKKEF